MARVGTAFPRRGGRQPSLFGEEQGEEGDLNSCSDLLLRLGRALAGGCCQNQASVAPARYHRGSAAASRATSGFLRTRPPSQTIVVAPAGGRRGRLRLEAARTIDQGTQTAGGVAGAGPLPQGGGVRAESTGGRESALPCFVKSGGKVGGVSVGFQITSSSRRSISERLD